MLPQHTCGGQRQTGVSPSMGSRVGVQVVRLVQHTLCPTGILLCCSFVVPKNALTDPVTGV